MARSEPTHSNNLWFTESAVKKIGRITNRWLTRPRWTPRNTAVPCWSRPFLPADLEHGQLVSCRRWCYPIWYRP